MEVSIKFTRDDLLTTIENGTLEALTKSIQPKELKEASKKTEEAPEHVKEVTEETPTEPEAAPPVTREEVRAKFVELNSKDLRDALKGILVDVGAKSISSIPDDQLSTVMDALTALEEEKKE